MRKSHNDSETPSCSQGEKLKKEEEEEEEVEQEEEEEEEVEQEEEEVSPESALTGACGEISMESCMV